MKFLVGVGMGTKPSFDPVAGTLTFDERIRQVKAKNVLLIVNCTTNQILHNYNNTDLQGDWDAFDTDGVFNLHDSILEGTMADTDEIHAWIEIGNGVAGIDFLSDLAIKSQTYAALNDIDVSLEGGISLDMTTTNQYLGPPNSSAAEDGTVTGELKGANIALGIPGTSVADDGTVTGELIGANAHLANLAEIPMTFFMDTTDNIIVTGAITGNFDLSLYSTILSVRSLDNATEVTIERPVGAPLPGLSSYILSKDDVLDMVCNKITLSDSGAGANAKAIVYAIK